MSKAYYYKRVCLRVIVKSTDIPITKEQARKYVADWIENGRYSGFMVNTFMPEYSLFRTINDIFMHNWNDMLWKQYIVSDCKKDKLTGMKYTVSLIDDVILEKVIAPCIQTGSGCVILVIEKFPRVTAVATLDRYMTYFESKDSAMSELIGDIIVLVDTGSGDGVAIL